MDDNNYTYPEPTIGAGFSQAEQKRWARNLKKLKERVAKKFGDPEKRGRPKKNG